MVILNADLLSLMYNRFIKVSHSSNGFIDVDANSIGDKMAKYVVVSDNLSPTFLSPMSM